MGWGPFFTPLFFACVCPITLALLSYKDYSYSNCLYTLSKSIIPTWVGLFLDCLFSLFLLFFNTTCWLLLCSKSWGWVVQGLPTPRGPPPPILVFLVLSLFHTNFRIILLVTQKVFLLFSLRLHCICTSFVNIFNSIDFSSN